MTNSHYLKWYVWPFFILALLVVPISSRAQDQVSFVSNTNSDYSICVDYHVDVNDDVCFFEPYLVHVNATENDPDQGAGSYYISIATNSYDGQVCGNVGPGFNQVVYGWINHFALGDCISHGTVYSFNATNEEIRPPTNVQATDGDFDTKIVITWLKATDIPDNKHSYRIYRDNSLIATVQGTAARKYTDSGLVPGVTHTYSVHTFSSYFGNQESVDAQDEGSTFSVGLIAADGLDYGKTKLKWNDLSDVSTDIRVERSIPSSMNREELAILNKYATTYTDADGIAGYHYTYFVTPIDTINSFLTGQDVGYTRPNGTISGHVTSPQGAGVDSVLIYAELISTILDGGEPHDPACIADYCTMTDISGYYEIEDIYYFNEANFKIYPVKGTHLFEPDTLERKLSSNSQSVSLVDFTDLNVITVGGRVTYPQGPGSQDACGVADVTILLNHKDVGIRTDEDGNWLSAVNNEGLYTFSAELYDHVYKDPNGDAETSLFINSAKTNIDFENKTLRTIHVIAQGGCQAPLGSSVDIKVSTPGNCFTKTYQTDQFGLLTLDSLPPRDYVIAFENVNGAGSNESNIEDQLSEPITIDLAALDTMITVTNGDSLVITPAYVDTTGGVLVNIPADTVFVEYQDTTYSTEPIVRFIYRSPIQISIDFEDAGADVFDCNGNTTIVLDQRKTYFLDIDVREMFGNCKIDTGQLVIYDEIGDLENVGQKIPISNGIARYALRPGNPDLATSPVHNHEKFLYIIPKIDFADAAPLSFWAIVTGIKSNTPSFITRTPEIPSLILHDPPGDNSFMTISKGTTFTTTTATEINVGGEGGLYLNFKGGPAANIFGAKIKAGGLIEFEAKAGRDNNDNNITVNTITFLQDYSTSPGETFIGEQGDVYIGSALNQTFALSKELTFDGSSCETSIDDVVEMGFTDFATTFIYTEYHIANSLLPTLNKLKDLADTTNNDGRTEYNRLLADISLWNQILASNRAARDTNAVFKKNISFSSGADYTASEETTGSTEHSYTYNAFFETSLKIGVLAEVESPTLFLEMEGGAMGTFRTSRTEVRDTVNENTRSVSYTLSDNDIGDFFSIDVLRDTVFDIPAFRTVSGTSSCPHEVNTQPREVPAIGVFPPAVNNVDPESTAKFVLSITNNSESGETRQYAVKLVPNSNPDGAIVNVAGSDVNTFPVAYFFDADQTIDLSMTVTKGPLASNYDSIGITIYSECEYDIWGDGGNLTQADTTWFSVNFLSQCTNVSLHLPNQGWLVNQASNNLLHTAFTGYDLTNPYLQSLTLQLKRDGYGYVDQITIPKNQLIGPFYDYYLDVSNFPDGQYTVRARANCGLDGGTTYSSEVSGIIDRTSLAPFGIPTPSDGFLREGQEVSVTFDKNLNCDYASYPHEFSLIREDNQQAIPFTTNCFGNKVIFNTVPPLIDQPDLAGVLLTARVAHLQDGSGNIQEYPTEWSFLVNVNPVFWDPGVLAASGMEGQSHIIHGVLKNTSLLSKAFSLDVADSTLITYPSWLTPIQKRGTILPNNAYTVDFAVDADLPPGLYNGTVTAMVDQLPVTMEVTFEQLANPVNWIFDASAYQYSMTMVLQFSLDGGNTNLSADTRDVIAAFVNGQIRGITNIEYLPALDIYRAFLTIYSNDQGGSNGENVKFKFWRALTGVEYGAIESVTFTLDNAVGTVGSPTILHPEGFFQVIPLKKGWNWISLNLATADMSREHLFENLLNSPTENSITIKSKTQTAQYNPGSSWNGNLSTLELGSGYLVNLSNAPDTLRVVGLPSASTIVLNVGTGWNWIGFPRLNPEPVNDVLSTLTKVNGDILKSQDRFTSWDVSTQSWLGNLDFFTPGKGYKLKLANAGIIIYEASRSDNYDFNPYAFEYNMNVTGFADLQMVGERHEEEFIIGAFIDGECRGTGKLEYIDAAGEYRTLMLVNGNTTDFGKPIEFRLFNQETGAEYITNGEQLNFVADGLVGNVVDPYLFFSNATTGVTSINEAGYQLEQNRPNPTSGRTSFGFTLPNPDHVVLRLYDLQGYLIQELIDTNLDAGHHTVEADLTELNGGVYYYELKTTNFNGIKKLVRQ